MHFFFGGGGFFLHFLGFFQGENGMSLAQTLLEYPCHTSQEGMLLQMRHGMSSEEWLCVSSTCSQPPNDMMQQI